MFENDIGDVAQVVGKYLRTSGRNVAYIDYSARIQNYLAWYRGATAWHDYFIFNGENAIPQKRACLGMAKTVCEDWASLELNEKVEIVLEDVNSQKFVDGVLEKNNFAVMGSQLVELAFALGTGAIVQTIEEQYDGSYEIKQDYIHGDMIFPLNWDNGIIKECAFVKVGGTQKTTKYTIIMHVLDEQGNYWIKTVEVNAKGSVVKPFELGGKINESDYISEYETGSNVPMFQIIKPNCVNNYDKTNPLGMSIFGNSLDILKSIDTIYDSFRNEFMLGKKRIFVKSNLKKVQIEYGDGVTSQVDPNDTIFYQLDWAGEHQDKPPIYETDLTLREAEHTNALDTQLKLLSRKCMLGDNFYAFVNGAVARTATEVISSNSSLYKNKKKNDRIIKQALIGMVRAILTLANKYNLGNFNVDQKISINFDDSIIEDTDKEFDKALKLYNAGIIDRVDFFVRVGEYNNREQAMQFIKEMDASDTMKDLSAGFGGFGGI